MMTSKFEHKIDHSYFYKVSSDKHSYLTPRGGGGHSHICPVQVCAAVKTPFFT